MPELYFKRPTKLSNSNEKWKHSIRLPVNLLERMREVAKKEYKGNSKISQFAEEALRNYLAREQVTDIDWDDPMHDLWYSELVSDIKAGSRMGTLAGPTKLFFSQHTRQKLIDLEIKLKVANPLLDNVRSNTIRRACFKWLHAERALLNDISVIEEREGVDTEAE